MNVREEAETLREMALRARLEGAYDLADLYDALGARLMLHTASEIRIAMMRGLEELARVRR